MLARIDDRRFRILLNVVLTLLAMRLIYAGATASMSPAPHRRKQEEATEPPGNARAQRKKIQSANESNIKWEETISMKQIITAVAFWEQVLPQRR